MHEWAMSEPKPAHHQNFGANMRLYTQQIGVAIVRASVRMEHKAETKTNVQVTILKEVFDRKVPGRQAC